MIEESNDDRAGWLHTLLHGPIGPGRPGDGTGKALGDARRRNRSMSRSLAHTLRVKFVILGTSSILMVLSMILGIAEMTIYSEIIETADHTLTLLADSNGTFPDDPRTYGLYDEQITRETPYESIWFIVRTWDEGSPEGTNGQVGIDTSKTVSVDEDTAKRYAEIAAEDGHTFGFVNSFRYIHRKADDGDLFVFLDRGRQLQTFYKGAFATIVIAAIGVAAVVVILILASKPVMHPFVENHAKQREFITNAGHDIKTPLTIIAADADVLSLEIGEDNEWLSDIRRQVDELTKLTNDLIFLSRMDEDRDERDDVPFDLSDALTGTVNSFTTVAHASGKALECDIADGITVRGDEKMLRQLSSVLIDNAIKYSDDGGTISVTLSRKRKVVTLSVRNTTDETGDMGVARWFDRFYQADSSRNSERSGFGIGLSIAQAVVATHGGQIRATARDGIVEIVATMPIGQ